MSEPRVVEMSADGTKAGEEAWDEVWEAVAESAERGLTWLDVDGTHTAAVVSPEFGMIVELLMRRDYSRAAERVNQASAGPAEPARHGSPQAWAESMLGMCRNCGKSRSEHCRGHLMPHCSGFCYGTRPPKSSDPGTSEAIAWELSHTWAAPVDEPEPERRPWQEAGGGWQSRLDPPSSRSEE